MSSSIEAYYPLGAAACCTPSVLLASGDAWELERCDCVASADVNCGGTASHRLLSGFDRWRCALRPACAPEQLDWENSLHLGKGRRLGGFSTRVWTPMSACAHAV